MLQSLPPDSQAKREKAEIRAARSRRKKAKLAEKISDNALLIKYLVLYWHELQPVKQYLYSERILTAHREATWFESYHHTAARRVFHVSKTGGRDGELERYKLPDNAAVILFERVNLDVHELARLKTEKAIKAFAAANPHVLEKTRQYLLYGHLYEQAEPAPANQPIKATLTPAPQNPYSGNSAHDDRAQPPKLTKLPNGQYGYAPFAAQPELEQEPRPTGFFECEPTQKPAAQKKERDPLAGRYLAGYDAAGNPVFKSRTTVIHGG